ncbi:MAG: hypothetical protein ACKO1O_08825 [Erythrobacter sp.]
MLQAEKRTPLSAAMRGADRLCSGLRLFRFFACLLGSGDAHGCHFRLDCARTAHFLDFAIDAGVGARRRLVLCREMGPLFERADAVEVRFGPARRASGGAGSLLGGGLSAGLLARFLALGFEFADRCLDLGVAGLGSGDLALQARDRLAAILARQQRLPG